MPERPRSPFFALVRSSNQRHIPAMKRKTELIPDTLELTDRAELAIRHMTTNVDLRNRYLPYFYLNMGNDPPCCAHEGWDYGDVTARYIDALAGLRQMTGSRTGMGVEAKLKALLLRTFSEGDGLTYRQKHAWSNYEAGMFDQGRTLTALCSWYMATGDRKLLKRGEQMVCGLWDIAIHVVRKDRGYAFCSFPYGSWFPDGWNSAEPSEATCYGGGCDIHPLVRFHELTGFPLALELAERLVNLIVLESGVFREDGNFRPKSMFPEAPHFHSKTLTILGILRYALMIGRRDLVDWAQRAFEFALSCGTSFGWFPEGVGPTDADSTVWSETCCTTDMIEIAILLAKNGHPRYWNQVERFTRNYLAESQITDVSWIGKGSRKRRKDNDRFCFTDAKEKMLGGFVGRCIPHDLIADAHQMACCCGAGARALYQVMDNCVTTDRGRLTVNLLLNRRGSWGEVHSWLPHQGRVVVRPAKACAVRIRMPDWLSPASLDLSVDGEKRTARVVGNWLNVSDVCPGSAIEVRFEVPRFERREWVLMWTLDVSWRGDVVTGVLPRGEKRPMYDRGALDTDEVALRLKPPTPDGEPNVHW
jgi:hypothetical protein